MVTSRVISPNSGTRMPGDCVSARLHGGSSLSGKTEGTLPPNVRCLPLPFSAHNAGGAVCSEAPALKRENLCPTVSLDVLLDGYTMVILILIKHRSVFVTRAEAPPRLRLPRMAGSDARPGKQALVLISTKWNLRSCIGVLVSGYLPCAVPH